MADQQRGCTSDVIEMTWSYIDHLPDPLCAVSRAHSIPASS
jgi:hypothetical protein